MVGTIWALHQCHMVSVYKIPYVRVLSFITMGGMVVEIPCLHTHGLIHQHQKWLFHIKWFLKHEYVKTYLKFCLNTFLTYSNYSNKEWNTYKSKFYFPQSSFKTLYIEHMGCRNLIKEYKINCSNCSNILSYLSGSCLQHKNFNDSLKSKNEFLFGWS